MLRNRKVLPNWLRVLRGTESIIFIHFFWVNIFLPSHIHGFNRFNEYIYYQVKDINIWLLCMNKSCIKKSNSFTMEKFTRKTTWHNEVNFDVAYDGHQKFSKYSYVFGWFSSVTSKFISLCVSLIVLSYFLWTSSPVQLFLFFVLFFEIWDFLIFWILNFWMLVDKQKGQKALPVYGNCAKRFTRARWKQKRIKFKINWVS